MIEKSKTIIIIQLQIESSSLMMKIHSKHLNYLALCETILIPTKLI